MCANYLHQNEAFTFIFCVVNVGTYHFHRPHVNKFKLLRGHLDFQHILSSPEFKPHTTTLACKFLPSSVSRLLIVVASADTGLQMSFLQHTSARGTFAQWACWRGWRLSAEWGWKFDCSTCKCIKLGTQCSACAYKPARQTACECA